MGNEASTSKAKNYKGETAEKTECKEDTTPKQNDYNDGTEGMIEDTASKCSAKQKELEEIVSDIQEKIERDHSMPNLIRQFSRIINLGERGKMAAIQQMVKEMDSKWNGIFKNAKAITEVVGKDQIIELKNVRCDYYLLLLKTKKVMVGLMEQSKKQRKNIARMSKVANKARDEDKPRLTKVELADYREGVKLLTKWIDESDLKDLIVEWNDLCKILEGQKGRMQKLFDEFKQKASEYASRFDFWEKVVLGIGALVILGATIGIVIASGAAMVVGIGTAVAGGLVCAGTFIYKYYVKPDKIVKNVQKITNMLNEYIRNCEVMQRKLNEVGGVRAQIEVHAEDLGDSTSVGIMIDAFEEIDKHLENYVTEGQKVVTVIDKACDEFAKK